MQDHTLSLHVLCTGLHNRGETGIKRVGETDMSNDTSLEESERSDALGTVNDLVRNDKVHRLDLLLQRPDSGEGNDASYTDVAQSSDIGAIGDLVGSELVVYAVSSEKSDVDAFVSADIDR